MKMAENNQKVDLLALENQFCFALYSANLAMTKTYKSLLEQLDLTYPQYLVMLVLWQQDAAASPLTVKEIGHALHLDSGTLTPLLKRMETAGLILRQRSKEDERQVNIVLSDAGRQLKQRAQEVPQRVLCASGASVAHLSRLRNDLNTLRDTLNLADPNPPSP